MLGMISKEQSLTQVVSVHKDKEGTTRCVMVLILLFYYMFKLYSLML